MDFYPAMRLFIPQKDKRMYGMKAKALAETYINALSIRGTDDAETLSNWTAAASTITGGNIYIYIYVHIYI